MKWGKKNGPPYPLKYSDLSPEEKAKAKEKAIRNGNIKEAANNLSEFNDNELEQLKRRYNLNQEVKKLNAATVKTGADKVDDIMKAVGKATNWLETGIKAYNAVNKLNNLGKKSTNKTVTDQMTLADGTKRTIVIKDATDKDIKNVKGYGTKTK